MTFGKGFGKLVRQRRGIEGLTQQALAVLAFGDEAAKTRISELENGKVANPHIKTIDAIAVALNIPEEQIVRLLNETPHPKIVDNMTDFFELGGHADADIEIAANASGKVVMFHNRNLKVEIARAEYFSEEKMMVFLEARGRRRPAGLPLGADVDLFIRKGKEILFVYLDDDTGLSVEGKRYPLKIID